MNLDLNPSRQPNVVAEVPEAMVADGSWHKPCPRLPLKALKLLLIHVLKENTILSSYYHCIIIISSLFQRSMEESYFRSLQELIGICKRRNLRLPSSRWTCCRPHLASHLTRSHEFQVQTGRCAWACSTSRAAGRDIIGEHPQVAIEHESPGVVAVHCATILASRDRGIAPNLHLILHT